MTLRLRSSREFKEGQICRQISDRSKLEQFHSASAP
jgi:hypothetical protein